MLTISASIRKGKPINRSSKLGNVPMWQCPLTVKSAVNSMLQKREAKEGWHILCNISSFISTSILMGRFLSLPAMADLYYLSEISHCFNCSLSQNNTCYSVH